jgi:hypothetical protein
MKGVSRGNPPVVAPLVESPSQEEERRKKEEEGRICRSFKNELSIINSYR